MTKKKWATLPKSPNGTLYKTLSSINEVVFEFSIIFAQEIADEFLEFINEKKLIIHNAPFDISFINHELKKINKNPISLKNVVDTLELAREKFPGTSNSLDNLCKRFNIDLSRRTKHNALLDCELLREVYINLVGQKEPSLSFRQKEDQLIEWEISKIKWRELDKLLYLYQIKIN